MKGKIDLQSHTTASDGEQDSKQLIDLAIERNIKALAITDHDTIDGIAPALEFAHGKEIEIIPGIEISCDAREYGFKKVDVLGLLIDHTNKKLAEVTSNIKKERILQKKKIIEKINKLGFDLSFEEVLAEVKGSFGRPHIARILLKKYPEEFSSIEDAFQKYLGEGKPAYVDRSDRIDLNFAINLIKGANGIPILAHPGVFQREESIELIEKFIEIGGQGIETFYPYNIIVPGLSLNEIANEKMIDFYRGIAKKKKILESGGNDHHGKHRDTLGKLNIPYKILENLRNRISC
jgi:3',5'-nucleoside bisphosphate phosphatase